MLDAFFVSNDMSYHIRFRGKDHIIRRTGGRYEVSDGCKLEWKPIPGSGEIHDVVVKYLNDCVHKDGIDANNRFVRFEYGRTLEEMTEWRDGDVITMDTKWVREDKRRWSKILDLMRSDTSMIGDV